MKYVNLFLIFGLVFVLLFSGCVSNQKEETIKIAAILPLTESAAYYGLQAQKGIELAKDELVKDGKYEIYYENSYYTPKGAVEGYTSSKSLRNLDAIITLASHVSMAVQPFAKQDNILQIATATTSPAYSTPNDLSFRVMPSIDVHINKLVEYVGKKGYKKVALLILNNDFGKGARNVFVEKIKSLNVEIVADELYLLDEKDFKTELSKIKSANPDLIYVIGTATSYVTIFNQAKEIGLDKPYLSVSSTEDPVLLQNNIASANIIYTYYNLDYNSNLVAKKFLDNYFTKYGEFPDGYAAEGYEALGLIVFAFDTCGKDYNCIQNYLLTLKDHNSIFSNMSFDANGDVYYDLILKTIKEGKFVNYEE